MKFVFVAAMASALFISTGPALAGELLDAAAKAEQLMAQGEFNAVLSALDNARDSVWEATPMAVRNAIFTAADPQGFGVYDIKQGSTFKRSNPIIIYAEPVDYGFGRDGEIYVIDLGLDFVIKSPDGKILAQQENFGSLTLRSRVPNKEFMAKLTYDFSGLPAGDYQVTTNMKDKNSDKSTEFAMKFDLVD